MSKRVAEHALALAGAFLAAASVVSARPLFAQNWHDLSPKERYNALQNFRRHEQLPEDRQHEVEKRYERWRDMSPDERARVRQNYERFRQLPPRERERFQRKYEKWKQQGETHQ